MVDMVDTVDTVISMRPYRDPFQYMNRGLAVEIVVKDRSPYVLSYMKNFLVEDVVQYICRVVENFGGTCCEIRRCPQVYNDGSREFLDPAVFYEILELLKPALNSRRVHLASVSAQVEA